jgi:hypothetical protein
MNQLCQSTNQLCESMNQLTGGNGSRTPRMVGGAAAVSTAAVCGVVLVSESVET